MQYEEVIQTNLQLYQPKLGITFLVTILHPPMPHVRRDHLKRRLQQLLTHQLPPASVSQRSSLSPPAEAGQTFPRWPLSAPTLVPPTTPAPYAPPQVPPKPAPPQGRGPQAPQQLPHTGALCDWSASPRDAP